MRSLPVLAGSIGIAALAAFSAAKTGAEEVGSPQPKLPPPAKLLSGQPHRAPDGSIAVQEAGRTQLRVCPAPQGPGCQFTELAAAAAAAGPGAEIVLAPGIYKQGAVLAAQGLVLRGEPGAHLQGN